MTKKVSFEMEKMWMQSSINSLREARHRLELKGAKRGAIRHLAYAIQDLQTIILRLHPELEVKTDEEKDEKRPSADVGPGDSTPEGAF